MAVNAKWPGCTHDSKVFKNSEIGKFFEEGKLKGILVGDRAYAIKPYLMKQYSDPIEDYEKRLILLHRYVLFFC